MSAFALADVPHPDEWRRNARCRTAPLSLFFPTRGDDVGQAVAVCKGCAVVAECRTYALAHPELRGIWGGLSEEAREQMRRRSEAGR